MNALARINPFFAARFTRVPSSTQSRLPDEPQRPLYARLPMAPKNASPVPHLTSLYHFHRAGEYGDRTRAATLDVFLRRYGQFIRNCALALKPNGKLAILMGDYQDREAGFVPLTWHTKRLAFAARLRQHGTDIIRFSHGASSSRKTYRSSFIPGLHDVCTIFEKQS
jgi:hypothetical protein